MSWPARAGILLCWGHIPDLRKRGVKALRMDNERELDIAKNVKIIEWLKSEILLSIAELFRMLASSARVSSDSLADCLASIIVASYLLGKRLGIHFGVIEQKIANKIRLGILEEHEIEKDYGDLSELRQHIKASRE
ncbi:MAG: hypothetical protein PWR01_259 [Clostridiales bacterium]|jgi:hypothetical protein|nr:hypothetical protein [Clostridiales bacterium]